MTLENNFPLISLQPIVDAHHIWTALWLKGEAALETPTLVRILNDYGLADILHELPCLISIKLDGFEPNLLANVAAENLQLAISATDASDPALASTRSALSAAGYTLRLPDTLPQPVPATEAAAPPKKEAPGRTLLLKLLTLVTSDADADEIEAVIKRDPNLSYQLLKLVNSVAFAPGKKITGFSQAIAMLGRRQLQRWLQLLLYARQSDSPHASPLLARAAQRAGLMEALAKRQQLSHEIQDHAFMVGMFSLLDQLFGVPVAEVIKPLNLPDPVVQGLVQHDAQLGLLLSAVIANDGMDGTMSKPILAEAVRRASISFEDWAAAQVEAVRWAVQVSKEA
jgi:c-di-GMP phosphodiesterase